MICTRRCCTGSTELTNSVVIRRSFCPCPTTTKGFLSEKVKILWGAPNPINSYDISHMQHLFEGDLHMMWRTFTTNRGVFVEDFCVDVEVPTLPWTLYQGGSKGREWRPGQEDDKGFLRQQLRDGKPAKSQQLGLHRCIFLACFWGNK